VSLLRHPNDCVNFTTRVWWVVALTGVFVAGWDTLHILIAGGFALRTIKVARQADARRALQEKAEGST
jgi:hypothetical protein